MKAMLLLIAGIILFIILMVVLSKSNYTQVCCMQNCDSREDVGSCIAECYNEKLISEVSCSRDKK